MPLAVSTTDGVTSSITSSAAFTAASTSMAPSNLMLASEATRSSAPVTDSVLTMAAT